MGRYKKREKNTEDTERNDLGPMPCEDLLGRPQTPIDNKGIERLVQGRVVLITGAGGTIGAELARQIARLSPKKLVLLDHGEFALWRIDIELTKHTPQTSRDIIIANVRDEWRLNEVMQTFSPELVFHAAALKHVPMVEANPTEGILTNVHGTRVVADAAAHYGAQAFVLISTDKAVNPSGLMGASKRAAEMYCQALDIRARAAQTGQMRCVTVRFGNVLESTGSVVPLFRYQIKQGGPLTVTHPEIRRYFMTVSEAVSLVLQASVRGTQNHESGLQTDTLLSRGGIFVLDMGEPVRILDLARQMIRLAGLQPEKDVPIHFTGLRPGEKLEEELFHQNEAPLPTDTKGLLMATPRVVDLTMVTQAVIEMTEAAQKGQKKEALQTLARLVPEFTNRNL
ncbi:MAG: polysaccharide biosynthesis protein [Acetobacter sp.]|nr:polysaccharide biosynthesis protein [Acetobacter sp.]